MKIASEQEMIRYGELVAEQILSDALFPGSLQGARPNLRPLEKGYSATRPADSFPHLVIELVGDVGAGKTTFVRGLARGLGVKEPVTSPSFTISKAYALPHGGNLVHYDFYRLAEPGLMAEDFSENMNNPDNVVVVEWGESVKGLLPQKHMNVTIKYNDDNTREVEIKWWY